MLEPCPKVRSVEAYPVEISGQRMVCLRDPFGISGKMLAVPLPAFFIMTLLNGQSSIQDIQGAFARQFGDLIFEHEIQELLRQMDENYLLDNERFHEYRRQLQEEFSRAPARSAWHAGKVYPADAEDCRQALRGYFIADGGPGLPESPSRPDTLRGAIAPHIDFMRGGWCFAWAYKELAEACAADLFLIFGTAHGLMRHPFALTRKDYHTPFGPLVTDQAFIDTLLEAYQGPDDLFADEFEHRSEHSIEFQAVFLQYLFSGARRIKAVPILCGSLHECVQNGTPPAEERGFSAFIRALKTAIEAAEQRGQKVFFLCGADLAHMGPRFGDPFVTDAAVLQEIQVEDRRLLETVERLDALAFFQQIEKDKDKRRICGYPPIYSMLNLLQGGEGRLLKYGQRTDDGSSVTFASMAFYK